MKLTLPYPPSLNHYWRHAVVSGHIASYISAEGKAYRKAVATAVIAQRPGHAPSGYRLAVTLTAYPPDARARDLDNLPKAVLDALTHAKVWSDDCLIDALHVLRGPKVAAGQLVVEIVPIPMALERGAA